MTVDPAGNAKLAKNSQGGRRLRAKDDAAAAAVLAVSEGYRAWHANPNQRRRGCGRRWSVENIRSAKPRAASWVTIGRPTRQPLQVARVAGAATENRGTSSAV